MICDRFLEGVEQAVAARPDNPVAFFVPAKPPAYTNAIYRARDAGSASGRRSGTAIDSAITPSSGVRPSAWAVGSSSGR
jgi:hypothetical protein